MKILHLSTSDIIGGAARTAHKFHQQMLTSGYDSTMLVWHKKTTEANIIRLECNPAGYFWEKIYEFKTRNIKKTISNYTSSKKYGPFSDCQSPIQASCLKKYIPHQYDIINLHWVANFLDYRSFFTNFAGKKPIVWRLADMNPFTGGCHYDWDCEGYARGCGKCPQLESNDPNDLSSQIWRRKSDIFQKLSQDDLHIVTLCDWMNRKIDKSPFFANFPRTTINNGVDLQVFKPKKKDLIRKKLGITTKKRILLFLAENIDVRRKGLSLLLDAIQHLENKNDYALITVGNNQSTDFSILNTHYRFDITDNKSELADIYNAADVFCIPSLQENFPNTTLEALACGTPVIGFNVGGIPDIVKDGETGYLSKKISAKGLHDCIEHIFKDQQALSRMKEKAVQTAQANYDLNIQTAKYLKLYRDLVERIY